MAYAENEQASAVYDLAQGVEAIFRLGNKTNLEHKKEVLMQKEGFKDYSNPRADAANKNAEQAAKKAASRENLNRAMEMAMRHRAEGEPLETTIRIGRTIDKTTWNFEPLETES